MKINYTGRKIAIINNIGGVLEPLEAILRDIEYLGINEIYSLGNNIGFGGDSKFVIDMLECSGIKSVKGDYEKFCSSKNVSCGIEDKAKKLQLRESIIAQIGSGRLDFISSFPLSYSLIIGGQSVIICFSISDILVAGEPVNNRCDAIIQSGTNKNLCDISNDITIYTVKSSLFPVSGCPYDSASYFVLQEKENGMGFDWKERTVLYELRELRQPRKGKRRLRLKCKEENPFLKLVA